MKTDNKPCIFDYLDYRLYLRDLYEFYKETTTYFSYRYFAGQAQLSSPSFLKLVMDGKRNLSQESTEKFIHAFRLDNDQAEFFRTLVSFNQSSSAHAKVRWYQDIQDQKNKKKLAGKTGQDFWSAWIDMANEQIKSGPHTSNEIKEIQQDLNALLQKMTGRLTATQSSKNDSVQAGAIQ